MRFPRMTMIAATMTALLIAALPAVAQEVKVDAQPDPARVEAARALVKAMDAEGQALASIEQLRQALVARMQASEPGKVVGFAAYAEKELAKDGPRVKSFLSDMDVIAVQFYARNFTVEEMSAIAAFQKSDAGRKFNRVTPELGMLIAARMGQFQSDLIKAIEKGAAGGQP